RWFPWDRPVLPQGIAKFTRRRLGQGDASVPREVEDPGRVLGAAGRGAEPGRSRRAAVDPRRAGDGERAIGGEQRWRRAIRGRSAEDDDRTRIEVELVRGRTRGALAAAEIGG